MGFSCEIDTRDIAALGKRLRGELATVNEKAIRKAGRAALDVAKRTEWFKDRTGRLRRSLRTEYTQEGYGQWSATLTSDAPYAQFVESGTQPHPIYPSLWPISVLRWEEAGGQVVYAKSVQHPGTKATNFMAMAMTEVGEPTYRAEVARLVARIR